MAFVVNPTKPGTRALHALAERTCAARGLHEPLWYETTLADPGLAQTRAAVEQGAGVVIAVGGDGTARGVARGLIGSTVPLGLIPRGTGNLFARNLGLPLEDPGTALQIALGGTDHVIDVGWLHIGRDDAPHDHLFLVMAGLGFDAELMGRTDPSLKAQVGWLAYVSSGVRLWNARRLRVGVAVDGGPVRVRRARSVVIGNCGQLPAGIALMPQARPDDGWLDIAAIGGHGGLLGWVELLGGVLLQSIGRGSSGSSASRGPIEHVRARRARVSTDRIEAVQVDGDLIGRAHEITVRVEARAVRVRVA